MQHIPPEAFALTLEQDFHLTRLQGAVKQASREQLEEMCLHLARQMMVKDNAVKAIVLQDFRL